MTIQYNAPAGVSMAAPHVHEMPAEMRSHLLPAAWTRSEALTRAFDAYMASLQKMAELGHERTRLHTREPADEALKADEMAYAADPTTEPGAAMAALENERRVNSIRVGAAARSADAALGAFHQVQIDGLAISPEAKITAEKAHVRAVKLASELELLLRQIAEYEAAVDWAKFAPRPVDREALLLAGSISAILAEGI